MARYTGPKTRIARKFGEAIFGDDKHRKKKLPTWTKQKRKKSEYAIQLMEKQLNILMEF
jgi:small subunit ribosomal protein S4